MGGIAKVNSPEFNLRPFDRSVKMRVSAYLQARTCAAAAMDMWNILNKAGMESEDTARGSLEIFLDNDALDESDRRLLDQLYADMAIHLFHKDGPYSGFEIDFYVDRASSEVDDMKVDVAKNVKAVVAVEDSVSRMKTLQD